MIYSEIRIIRSSRKKLPDYWVAFLFLLVKPISPKLYIIGKNNIILEALNRNRFLRDAAKKLGISERTLYRRIEELNIIWDGNKYLFGN
jgi:hypothetical protein